MIRQARLAARLFAVLALACAPARAEVAPQVDEEAALEEVLDLVRAQVDGLEGPLELGPDGAGVACDPAHRPATRGLFIAAAEWTADADYQLYGPVNDAELIRNAMIARGARPENLAVLAGAAATRQGLTAAAADLLGATGCGDSVMLHASGWVFGADQLFPGQDPRGPFVFGMGGVSLADLAGRDLGVNPVRGVVAQGPYLILNQDTEGVSDVLNADALSDLVTRLRNRGADVTVVLDTSTAEEMRLEDRQARVEGGRIWRMRLRPDGAPEPAPVSLGAQAGALTVYYGTAVGELTVEMRLPRDSQDRRYYGVFSFRFAQALMRADGTDPAAISRRIAVDEGDGQVDRAWTYVFSTTDAGRDLIVETRPPEPPGGGLIRITDPAPSRAAGALDSASLTLRGQVEAPAETMIVTVNGKVAQSTPDGAFSFPLELEAGVNRVDVLAMTRDNRPLTHSFELYYEGDMQALLGNGTRYALIIANQDYPDGSGLADLATPVGDAQALADILRDRFGFVTEAVLPDGSAVPLMLTNAGRIDIEMALYTLSQVAGERDTVLIFYAGHGLYEPATDGAFWLPADAKMGLPFSYLPAAAITDAILRIDAGSVLVISDSCYSGALLRGGAAEAEAVADDDRLRALQRLASKRSRIVISSGANEPVADGGGEGHSVFARALLTGLAEMEEEAFTARELFDGFLLPMVVGRAAQEPQYRPIERAGHEGGDVVLARLADAD